MIYIITLRLLRLLTNISESRKRKAQIGPDGKVTKRKTLDEKSDAVSLPLPNIAYAR